MSQPRVVGRERAHFPSPPCKRVSEVRPLEFLFFEGRLKPNKNNFVPAGWLPEQALWGTGQEGV